MSRQSKRLAAQTPLRAMIACALCVAASSAYAGTFSNPTALVLPDQGVADVYPSQISVAGQVGLMSDILVMVDGINHNWPDDICLVLVAPNGKAVRLMADVGGGDDLAGVDITFDGLAADSLPDGTGFGSGFYRPTTGTSEDIDENPCPVTLPLPAPQVSYSNRLQSLLGVSGNGSWALYAFDDTTGDSGTIADGWSLTIANDAIFINSFE